MKRSWLVVSLCIGLSTLAWLFLGDEDVLPAPQTPRETLQFLAEQQRNLDPNSMEAQRLQYQMDKVRGRFPKPELPGAALKAFGEIKTGRDGTRYGSNYKRRELEKALARRKGKRGTPVPWINRGPGNVSGRARAVICDPADPANTWYAASVGGGIWKTTDAGVTWTDKTPALTALTTTCLVQSPSQPDIMYAGTGMGYGRIVDLIGSGIWKSTDRGESWTQLPTSTGLYEAVNRIVVHPNDPDTLLFCGNDGFSHLGTKGGERFSGIYRSTDGGQNWTMVFDSDAFFGPETDNRVQQIIHPKGSFDYLLATVNEVGVIKSTDGGVTWYPTATDFALPSDIGNPPTQTNLAGVSVRTELAVSPSDPTRVYAAVERPRGIAELMMSRDSGETWTEVVDTSGDPNWFNISGVSGENGAYTAGWFTNTIAVSPFDPNVVFVGGGNLYRIDVNANAVTRETYPIAWWYTPFRGLPWVHADHHWLELIPIDEATQSFRIVNANDAGVAVSFDGGVNWIQRGGMVTTQFYGADKKPGEPIYAAGAQDNGTWRSNADPMANSAWIKELGGDGFETVWHRDNPNLVLGTIQFGRVYRSEDQGVRWTFLDDATAGTGPFITKIAYSKSDPDLIFTVGSEGINRSDDFGLSWTTTTIDDHWLGFRPFDNVEISPADPRVVYISSRMDVDPETLFQGGIHVSTDGGLSFTEISANFPQTVNESSGIAPHPTDPGTAYFLFSAPNAPKILRTTDYGQTFTDLSGYADGTDTGFPNVAVYDLLVMPYDDKVMWAGTEIGLFISEDGGASWEYADNGLPHVCIFQMKIVEGQILVSTQGRGIWTVDLPELADYRLPQVTLTPRLSALTLAPSGNVEISLEQRSAYDETELVINGEVVEALAANENPQTYSLLYPPLGETVLTVQLRARRGEEIYLSPTQTLTADPKNPATSYVNDFDSSDAAQDFVGVGFSVDTPSGFSNGAIHSSHAYPDGRNSIYTLRVPLVVPEGEAVISFDEIVLVEPGVDGSVFGDSNFWDYVVVEGSLDGNNWTALADGIDSYANNTWLNTYFRGGSGDESMYVSREIDFSGIFNPGDLIFIRFRLFADAVQNGWGWAVDNLSIFEDRTGLDGNFAHKLVYPWVSNNDNFASILVVNNPTDEEAQFLLTARRESGIGEKLGPLTVPPNGFIEAEATELFSNLPAGSGFTVTMETNKPGLRGRWVTNDLQAFTGASPSQGVAVNPGNFTDRDNVRVGQSLLFGYLPVTDGFISAPVVVNLGEADTNVTLAFYNQAGELLLEDTTTLSSLEPGKPFARTANDLLPDTAENVTLIATSDSEPITGVVFVFNDQGETAIGNADVPAGIGAEADTDLLYAWISSNDAFESILIANNPGNTEADVILTALREDGSTETTTRTIQPHGFLEEKASSLFPAMHGGSGYTVRLESQTGGLRGRWVTNNLQTASGRSPSQGVAVRLPEDGKPIGQRVGQEVLFGYLPVTEGTISAPVVVNLGEEPADVTLFFYDAAGALVKTDTESLHGLVPHRPFARVANQLAGDEENLHMVARCEDAPITGVSFVFNGGLEPAIGNVTALDVTTQGKRRDNRLSGVSGACDTTFALQSRSAYTLPYGSEEAVELVQTYCGASGSGKGLRFAVKPGAPILAIRGGVLIAANHAFGYEHNHNVLFIRHDDGTVARYAGPAQYSLAVHIGDRVHRGQILAITGDHELELSVYPNSVNMDPRRTLPINFRNAVGPHDRQGGMIAFTEYRAGRL
ncbi:MAG: peptidoglycan DD-metalloendopeptidase family protein [Acidobacteriota bacterium]|nr:peptidoglycan DD-metalloendopeptidase family protein [Acidobacteriota bacterium]